MSDERRPVFVGAAQIVQRDVDPAQAPEPLDLLERVARSAAADAGVAEAALRELDAIGIPQTLGWSPADPPRGLAERLGARPDREHATAVGGEMPIALVNHLARGIAAGEGRMALVAGVHLLRTLRRARKAGIELPWAGRGAGEPSFGANHPGSSPGEVHHGLRMPTDVYPIFENALRARRGLDFETHRRRMGRLMSRFTEVAAKNPYAWFPVARSADELTTPTPENRMIAYPYTKYLNAVMETDQAAALLLVSAGTARRLGIPEDRWVHWWGGDHAHEEAWYPSERPDFASCPALREAASGALDEAGVSLAALDRLDLYSCFPVAVEMACEMLGLEEDDARGFTVTGGLPYAGGPGNNYTLHSLATMIGRLRDEPGSRGLVTGNGWYLTKHAACVLASAPREEPSAHPRPPRARPNVAEDTASTAPARGRGRIEAYTVLYDREGAPRRGIVLGRLEEGRRFVANTPDDRALLEDFAGVGDVGREGRVSHREGHNLFDPA